LAVADGIREGRCNVKNLSLDMLENLSFEGTEAVKAFASAIRLDRSLGSLDLQMMNDFNG
jgi:hypothetical protein